MNKNIDNRQIDLKMFSITRDIEYNVRVNDNMINLLCKDLLNHRDNKIREVKFVLQIQIYTLKIKHQ